ncbi:hypothetical protein [Turneriella parva]|uniref:Uncharacterized protein n=1 Tax=Turneriella parva (strain ATCC BAA-1111 / DSM 21527 / NCTC 11395 / H) TaxID=869212 RepID=I4B1B6_TURPD|nr:hypothetical protein [Turneriella parva]AFM11073.1 hypothetical protein Turpa_0417 [Turneriella parva DSM 21527]
MENHSNPHPHRSRLQCGELLAQGKVARAEIFPCGHTILTFDNFKLAFAREDFYDFANTVAMATAHLQCRETERSEWGLFM